MLMVMSSQLYHHSYFGISVVKMIKTSWLSNSELSELIF